MTRPKPIGLDELLEPLFSPADAQAAIDSADTAAVQTMLAYETVCHLRRHTAILESIRQRTDQVAVAVSALRDQVLAGLKASDAHRTAEAARVADLLDEVVDTLLAGPDPRSALDGEDEGGPEGAAADDDDADDDDADDDAGDDDGDDDDLGDHEDFAPAPDAGQPAPAPEGPPHRPVAAPAARPAPAPTPPAEDAEVLPAAPPRRRRSKPFDHPET